MAHSKRDTIFTVRQAHSLEDMQWVMKTCAEEGYNIIGEKDGDCYFTANLTHDFFIGELNGERIGCVSAVRLSESLAFVSHYIILKPFRGNGYGLKMWKASVGETRKGGNCNMQLYSVMNMQEKYMRDGFHPFWMSRRHMFTVSQAAKSLSSCQPPSSVAKILPARQADFEKLTAYSKEMMGFSQVATLMLAAWVSRAQESSWVAIGNEDEVIGCLLMVKTTRFHEKFYRIAPFYSDSAAIARSLLKIAVEFAALSDTEALFLDTSLDNLEGTSIFVNEIGAKPYGDWIFMTTEAIAPNIPLEKIFGFASMDIMN